MWNDISLCYNSHFPDVQWCWAPFTSLMAIYRSSFVQNLLKSSVGLSFSCTSVILTYSGFKSLVMWIRAVNTVPVGSCPFTFLKRDIWVFYTDDVQHNNFFFSLWFVLLCGVQEIFAYYDYKDNLFCLLEDLWFWVYTWVYDSIKTNF